MGDPRQPGAAAPLPMKGEGCTRRFDPQALTAEHGADFSAAAELWHELQQQLAEPEQPPDSADSALPQATPG